MKVLVAGVFFAVYGLAFFGLYVCCMRVCVFVCVVVMQRLYDGVAHIALMMMMVVVVVVRDDDTVMMRCCC